MFDSLRYDFGYSWYVANGHLVPLALGATLLALAVWRGWPRWLTAASGLLVAWSLVSWAITHAAFRIDAPMRLPTDRFLASGAGRVLDVGAGSGRAGIGLLLARPASTLVALDIYDGYFGIDDNTPERFMANARLAGVDARAEARTGDMRQMPFADGEFDAAISAYAIDHVNRDGRTVAVREVARVLKPGGELLLMIVNPDPWAWLTSPHAIAHHGRPDPAWWQSVLETSGFRMVEQGRTVGTLYFLARRGAPRAGRG
jgi:SAM-dependent methyltransferase